MLADALAVAPAWRNNKHRWLWVPDQRSLCSLVRDDVNFVPEAGSNFQTAETISDTTPHSRGAMRPRFCKIRSPKENRGRRECRVPNAPAVSRAKLGEAHERSHHRLTGLFPAFPAQWFYGLFRALPGDQACLTPSPALLIANLTPASGRQNHTTSPSASARFVTCAARVHRIPPRVRDDRDTPLKWDETVRISELIWVRW